MKIDKKYVLIGGILGLIVVVGMLWQLGVFEGGPGEVPPSGQYLSFGKIKPESNTLTVNEGVFSGSFTNIAGTRIIVKDVNVTHDDSPCNVISPKDSVTVEEDNGFEIRADCFSRDSIPNNLIFYVQISYDVIIAGTRAARLSEGYIEL